MQEFNLQETILIQYQKSLKFLKLLETLKKIDPYLDLVKIYNDIWNIKTANTHGLDIWGKILNVGRVVELSGFEFFGFKESDFEPFNQSPFYTGRNTGYFRLEDEQYRNILLLVANRNITSATLPELNKMTATLFKNRGELRVERAGIMKIKFIFEFKPFSWEVALLSNENIIPIPSSTKYSITINQ